MVYAFKSNANVNYAGAINAQSLNNTGVPGAIGFASQRLKTGARFSKRRNRNRVGILDRHLKTVLSTRARPTETEVHFTRVLYIENRFMCKRPTSLDPRQFPN